MEKHLAIIGASYLQLPLIKKAKEMGFTTHVFAWAANDVGEKEADHFYPISIIERDEILEKCREIGICGICSIASDVAMLTVNYIAQKLGLISNDMEATVKSTNKHEMRKTFEVNGDPSPKSILIDENTDLSRLDIEYPIIVKPTDRSGSRGIFKLYNASELAEAVKSAISESFEKKALVEEFAEGKEYSVEFISFEGKHTFLQITEKFTTGEPHFIETGHLEPASVSEDVLEKVKGVVIHALDSLGIRYGASHSEVKIDDNNNIKIIEIGGRMGGDCIGSDLVFYSTGYDFVKMVIDIAIGKEPEMKKEREAIAVKSVFMSTQEDVDAYEQLKSEQPEKIIKLVNYNPKNIGKTTDSSNRVGCYIIKA